MSTNDWSRAVGGDVAAGWYVDPWEQAAQRFWDGARWTPHTSAGGAPSRPRLPEGAPIYGPSIWLLAVLPVLSSVALWLGRPDASAMTDYLRAMQDAAQAGGTTYLAPPNPWTMLGPGYAVAVLLSSVLYVVMVVLAQRDRSRLSRAGVVRPFHWAWAFLSVIVYVIGRSVVVRKVAGPRGLAPMWTAIAVQVVAQLSIVIWMAVLFGSMVQQLSAGAV